MKPTLIRWRLCWRQMPPTRGHDLKLAPFKLNYPHPRMPPTRGHDLKLSAWPKSLMSD